MKKIFILVAASGLFILAGCSRDLEVSVNFTQPQTVKPGDAVKFKGVEIGRVDDVDELDQGVAVELDLDPEKAGGLSSASAAMVINNNEPYVELYSAGTGDALESGAQIQGLNNPVDLATWTAGNALGSLQGLATSAASAFNQFLNENNWDELAAELNESLSELNEQSAGALNELGGDLEEFIKQMQQRSAESLEQADELSRQLNEELEKFQNRGQEDIARALQNMLDAFNSALDPHAVPPTEEKGEPL